MSNQNHNQNLLIGAVLLETMWKSRKQDLVDLISPFVFYSVAKTCSPHEKIIKKNVRKRIRTEFGYKDLPVSIIEQVFTRNPRLFQKNGDSFYLQTSLDSHVQEIDNRRVECDEKLKNLGRQIAEYLSLHMRNRKEYTQEEGAKFLQLFFSKHGAYLGADKLEEHLDEIKQYEVDYNIAKFIFEKKDARDSEYKNIIDLVKGYFLRSAIYLQGENGELIGNTYDSVSFYYDTPYLLRLLGYKTTEDEESARELHNALKGQNAKFFYFPQTRKEIEGILNAYQRDIGRWSYVTLEGLDAQNYRPSDVERIKQNWENRLREEFDISIVDKPQYSGECNVIDEDDLKTELEKRVLWHTNTSRDADIESSVSIHMLRNGNESNSIEKAGHVFVTTNSSLAKALSYYYKNKINADAFPLLITDTDLSALTWIKCGSTNDLPELDLLRNAYVATQPTAEMLDKFSDVLDRMQGEGKVTEETAIAIRTYGYTKKQVLYASFDGVEAINENLVERIESMLREEYSNEARDDERRKAEKEKAEREHDLLENARKRANIAAAKAMDNQLFKERKYAKWISIAIIALAIAGAIWTLKDFSGWLLVFIIPFGVVSAKSVFDTVKQTEKGIDKMLKERANKTYDEVFEEKNKEYLELLYSETAKTI